MDKCAILQLIVVCTIFNAIIFLPGFVSNMATDCAASVGIDDWRKMASCIINMQCIVAC